MSQRSPTSVGSPLLSPLSSPDSDGEGLDEESIQRRLDRKLRREQRRQEREQKRQALEQELEEKAEARRRERQATLDKIAKGEEEEQAEIQEWVSKIDHLEEEGDKQREKVEQELQEEILKTRQEREEKRRSNSVKSGSSFHATIDSTKLPKISTAELSQVHLQSPRRGKSGGTSKQDQPQKDEEALAITSGSPVQSPKRVSPSSPDSPIIPKSEEHYDAPLASSSRNNSLEETKDLVSTTTTVVESDNLTSEEIDEKLDSSESRKLAEKSDVYIVVDWESKKHAEQSPVPTNEDNHRLLIAKDRSATLDAFKEKNEEVEEESIVESEEPMKESEYDETEKSPATSKNEEIEEEPIVESEEPIKESEYDETETEKPPAKTINSPLSSPLTTSPLSSPKAETPRGNVAALWRQREKEKQSEQAKPKGPPPLPPKKKEVLEKWNAYVAASSPTEVEKKVDGTARGKSTHINVVRRKSSGESRSSSTSSITPEKHNVDDNVNITTESSEVISSKIVRDVIQEATEETGQAEVSISKKETTTEEKMVTGKASDEIISGQEIIEEAQISETKISASEEKSEEVVIAESNREEEVKVSEIGEKKSDLPKIPKKIQVKDTLTGVKEKEPKPTTSSTEQSGGGKKKSRIAMMIEEQERKRKEEEEAAAAAAAVRRGPVGGRKILDKFPWLTQAQKSDESTGATSEPLPPPRKISSSFLTSSSDSAESETAAQSGPKIKTGKIDSAISQRLEGMFGSGKIPLPGMGRGMNIGARKVLISAEDVEHEENEESGEHRARVIPGMKRRESSEEKIEVHEEKKATDTEEEVQGTSEEKEIKNEEIVAEKTIKESTDESIVEEKEEKNKDEVSAAPPSKPLSHITKDRPRRPARSRPPIPKPAKVVPLPAHPKKIDLPPEVETEETIQDEKAKESTTKTTITESETETTEEIVVESTNEKISEQTSEKKETLVLDEEAKVEDE